MANHVHSFSEDLHATLSIIDAGRARVQALIADKAGRTGQEMTDRLAEVERSIRHGRVTAAAALAALGKWTVAEESEASGLIAEWKTKRQTGKLHARADRYEEHAAAAIVVAAAAMDEAERAVLRALLARKEAISIQVQQSGGP
jgi:hypothetical protein